MKFRWKLLILLLAISIIPIVGLRTFGIHNVRIMSKALIAQVELNQEREVKNRLRMLMEGYSNILAKTREEVEMALAFQMFEVKRGILQNHPRGLENILLGEKNVEFPEEKKTDLSPDFIVSAKDDTDTLSSDYSKQCFAVPAGPGVENAEVYIARLAGMIAGHQKVSEYLGQLVLWQYIGLESGIYSVYPCNRKFSALSDARRQIWYRSALKDNLTSWSRPYVDPISGRNAMAVSLSIEQADESIQGVLSLVVPMDGLLEPALFISDMPPNTTALLGTLASKPATDQVGIKILSRANYSATITQARAPDDENPWLISSDTDQFKALLKDIATRQHRIREMPYQGHMSYWLYGPLPHQGTAYIFIVPRDEILQQNHQVLEFIKNRLAKVENYTTGFLIFLVLTATALALTFSRTVTRPLEALSRAVQKLGQGDFEARVSIKSNDEFGDMGQVVNQVGPQLKEDYRMRRSLEVAMEVQQNLLPDTPPELPGLDIYGMTLFSDETGGDYFDYLCIDEKQKNKLCLVVGDVVGHGNPSALLMATARGFLRLRVTMPGTLGDIVTDVNREFAKDVEDSAQFMTLFLARIDRGKNRIDWVRAGHDPAILYDPETDSFSSLDDGNGIPLGISQDTVYTAASCDIKPGQIIFLGTDGIWETRNAQGELFGKERLQQVIHTNSKESARTIVLSVLDAVEEFRGPQEQEDDLTLVITRIVGD
jgi:sigma-B regulation protein RsbU (phosphoserine phosphatase)